MNDKNIDRQSDSIAMHKSLNRQTTNNKQDDPIRWCGRH